MGSCISFLPDGLDMKLIYPACLFICSLMLSACDFKSKPYIKHKLSFEKIAGDCYDQDTKMNIEANTIGERYVFQECLGSDFNGDYDVVRRGDTVEVKIVRAAEIQSLFKITLDINTRPVYHFLTINGNTIPVTVTRY